MPLRQVPRQPLKFELWREVRDTHSRSAMAGVYYLLAWPLTWLFSAAPEALMFPGLTGIALSIVLFTLHMCHRLPQSQDSATLKRWLNLQWALILASALSWGILNAIALSNDLFGQSQIIATLSSVAFSTAIAFSFGMRKLHASLALILLYGPPLIILALDWNTQYPLLISLLAYMLYLVLALRNSHRDYRRTIEMEMLLLQQQEHLDQLSRTDGLTQLGNRYQFNSLFPNMVASAQRQNQPLSLVLMDLDYFKQVNDVYGHACGDECLSAFADRMRLHFRRASDALLRLGGEEFAVLMPNTQLEHAQALADQFRIELARNAFNIDGVELQLTASIGVGCFDPATDDNPAVFYKRVDDALYKAKNAGRNSLVAA